MKPLSYLQNALIVGCVFATYWFMDSWWCFLWLVFWLQPSGKCECAEAPEEPKIIVEAK